MPGKDVSLQLTAIVIEDSTALTLVELSRACAVGAETIMELVDEGVILPTGRDPREWRFTGAQLRRANMALRLQRDLGINLPGVALAIELLDELDILRTRLRSFDSF